ncbi:MAG TPA: hypothetical protein VE621_10410 [Bryobacteraceae bacterium]|jgi:hypothetical protein|nr:hypothetical protein [Bryobacteraceae bacterium]
MQEENNQNELRSMMRSVIQEFLNLEQQKAEPAYKAELVEERRRREQLENRVNELVEENHRSRQMTEELERSNSIRSELQRLGVAKVDLAFKAVKDDIARNSAGRLVAKTESGEVEVKEYLTRFVTENPELLPARIPGGSGAGPAATAVPQGSIDIDKIRPGMSPEEMDRIRQEIARVASQTIRG